MYPYLMVKGLKYLSVIRPCKQIENHQYMCTEHNIVLHTEETCVEQLMKIRQDPVMATLLWQK